MQKFELTEPMLKLLNEHGARLKTIGESPLFMAIDIILTRAPDPSPAGTYIKLHTGRWTKVSSASEAKSNGS